MNYPGDLTVEELACVHVALQNQITERRQYLEAIAGPPHTFRTKIAERTAYWLRAAEHAYHKLGGTNPNYLPAVYRPPSPGRPAHNQNTTTSGTPSPPEAFAAPPPQVSPAGPDPTLGTPNPRQPSPTRAATPPPR